MPTQLEIGRLKELRPSNSFLQCELVEGQDPNETALEVPLFDFASTEHQMGARLISVPANRAFARHTHPNAHHFIYILEGTGIIEYDCRTYTLNPKECCLVRKGITHKLGAGNDGLLAIVVNTPTYENGDPAHVHYAEEETLKTVEVG
jgi:mannose-6-phosphate isomerase-like protein (cupin superfamily)